jgi:hypothetical protein
MLADLEEIIERAPGQTHRSEAAPWIQAAKSKACLSVIGW